MTPEQEEIREVHQNADNVIVLAGAGMSVELGTPAYYTGPYRKYGGTVTKYGLTDLEHATASFWDTHLPEQQQYAAEAYQKFVTRNQETVTSAYHELLQSLNTKQTYFVATTNVDNAFYDFGFNPEQLYELHGATRLSQCMNHPEAHRVFPTEESIMVCPVCGGPARPNVLYFDDYKFNDSQEKKGYAAFFSHRRTSNPKNTVVLELGVGNTIIPLRTYGWSAHGLYHTPVIRVNPEKDSLPKPRYMTKSLAPYYDVNSTVSGAFNWLL